jgi:hypothetical protein
MLVSIYPVTTAQEGAPNISAILAGCLRRNSSTRNAHTFIFVRFRAAVQVLIIIIIIIIIIQFVFIYV